MTPMWRLRWACPHQAALYTESQVSCVPVLVQRLRQCPDRAIAYVTPSGIRVVMRPHGGYVPLPLSHIVQDRCHLPGPYTRKPLLWHIRDSFQWQSSAPNRSYQNTSLSKNKEVRGEGGDVYQPCIPTSSMSIFSQKNSPAGVAPSRGYVRFMLDLCKVAWRLRTPS